jgi:hypothetical protein
MWISGGAMRRTFHVAMLGITGALLLAACGSAAGEWVKPGASDADYQSDRRACGAAASGFNPPVYDPRTMNAQIDGQAIAQQQNSCMFARGWTLAPRR